MGNLCGKEDPPKASTYAPAGKDAGGPVNGAAPGEQPKVCMSLAERGLSSASDKFISLLQPAAVPVKHVKPSSKWMLGKVTPGGMGIRGSGVDGQQVVVLWAVQSLG
jgi:hypothetical protein